VVVVNDVMASPANQKCLLGPANQKDLLELQHVSLTSPPGVVKEEQSQQDCRQVFGEVHGEKK
jgi:hypothetical protein